MTGGSGTRADVIGTSARMRDLPVAIIAHRGHVNLQLADGLDLPEPTAFVEGTGMRIRHVKCRLVDGARTAVLELFRAQDSLRSRG